MSLNIQRPMFDGVRQVRAMWFDTQVIGDAETRRRIIKNWLPGSRLYRALGGYLLEFPKTHLVRCAHLDGLPLCDVQGVLSSAPLTQHEHSLVPENGFCIVRGALPHIYMPIPADQIDPSIWLDLGQIPVWEPMTLPLVRNFMKIEPPEDVKSIRTILGDAIPEPSQERAAFLDKAQASLRRGRPTDSHELGKALALNTATATLGVLGLVISWFNKSKPKTDLTADRHLHQPRPSALSPFAQRLVNLRERLAVWTRVSKLLGWRQAEYLRKTLDMFERGDLYEALRHAIPLDDTPGASTQSAFGAPKRRDSLDVTGPNRLASSIGLGAELQTFLRQTYRQTFERLDRDGKIDEAVFVLAELLKAGSEAVTYLEKKGRIKQAAELAETMELPAEIIVRLWWLSGDMENAARHARLHNAFADAVQLLERNQSAEAGALRMLWSEHLLAQGDLTQAAEVIWSLPEHRERALAWLIQAERSTGTLSVRALVMKLSLQSDGLAESEVTINRFLRAQGEDGAQMRYRLALEIIKLRNHSSAIKRLASEVLRPLIAERLAGLNQLEIRDLNRLLQVSDTALLKMDLPTLRFPDAPPSHPLNDRKIPLHIELSEKGLLPLHDVHGLPDGEYLIAMGESGVIQFDRYGKKLAHFPIPAHCIVLSNTGLKALALAKRDNTYRISRLNLLTRAVSDWISLPLTFWADQYDGVTWNAVLENRLVAIDTSEDRLIITWQVADLPGKIVSFSEDQHSQTLLISNADGYEQWRYLLPTRRLNQRDAWPIPDSDVWRVIPSATHQEPQKFYLKLDQGQSSLVCRKSANVSAQQFELGTIQSEPNLSLKDGRLLILISEKYDTRCVVANFSSGQTVAELKIELADHPRVRAYNEHIFLFDRCGRMVDIDAKSGLVKTLTIS